MNHRDHWEQVYSSNPTKMGWYEPHLETSLSWIKNLDLAADAPILDVGGGASTLVDDLLDASYVSITVLDIAVNALDASRKRLGRMAQQVVWLQGDITSVDLKPNSFELWHDRAVLHFLTEPEQQKKYRDNLLQALRPGGHLIIGIFAPEAPSSCSGLQVQRYSPEELGRMLGKGLELERHEKELHTTPDGTEQMYLYCHFRRTAPL